MLAADKLQLQSALKQQATALKEKEFNLHHSNLMTVGTQAAVLAGLDITMFIEFNPYPDDTWQQEWQWWSRLLKSVYYGVIVAAFCANMLVVAHTTALSVLGASLALRGPDGSMLVATDVVYEERRTVFIIFGWGLVLTLGSVLISVWILLHWEAACICWVVTLVGCRSIYSNYQRVSKRLYFNEHDSVDFTDLLMTGPGAIRVINSNKKKGSAKKGGGGGGSNDSSIGSNIPPSPSKQGRNNNGRRFFKRSLSSPSNQNNQNTSDYDMSTPSSSAFSSHTRPSAHYHRHGDEEEGGAYYHSYSSEEDNDSTMLLVGHHQHDAGGGGGGGMMKQRRKQASSPVNNDQHQQENAIQTV